MLVRQMVSGAMRYNPVHLPPREDQRSHHTACGAALLLFRKRFDCGWAQHRTRVVFLGF
jgi:hypothetical protein